MPPPQPFVFKFGADETTSFAFRPVVKAFPGIDAELPEDVRQDAEYETVAAEAALSRASTHYFGLWVPHYIFIVGAEREEFLVHLSVLRLSCPTFEQRISKCSVVNIDKLSGGRVVEFGGQLASTFTLFITWLHTGFLVPLRDSAPSTGDDDLERLVGGPDVKEDGKIEDGADLVSDQDLARLFTFAEAEMIPQLQLTALAILHTQNYQHDRTTAKGAIKHLLANAKSGSGIFTFLAGEAAVFLSADSISSKLWDFPREYVQSALTMILRERDVGTQPADRLSSGVWGSRSVLIYRKGSEEWEEGSFKEAIEKAKTRPMPAPEIHRDYLTYVTVVVGFECLRFRVHKGLIQKHSDYCRGALRVGFPEAERNEIDFRQESVRDFALFLDFVYDQQIYPPSLEGLQSYDEYSNQLKYDLVAWKQKGGGKSVLESAGNILPGDAPNALEGGMWLQLFTFEPIGRPGLSTGAQNKRTGSAPWDEDDASYIRRIQDMLIDLFIFSDRRGVSLLRNSIINMLAEKRESGWPWLSISHERVSQAFGNLPSDSAMCRFLVDEAAWCWTSEFQNANDLDEYPDEFFAKVMKRWLQHGGRNSFDNRKPGDKAPPWRKDRCKAYHDHANEGERGSCQSAMKKWTGAMAWQIGLEPVVKKAKLRTTMA